MKTDKYYGYFLVCPETAERISESQMLRNYGVCVLCGNLQNGDVSHHKVLVGKWTHGNWFERLIGSVTHHFEPLGTYAEWVEKTQAKWAERIQAVG